MSKKEKLTGKAILAKKDEKSVSEYIDQARTINARIADYKDSIKGLEKQRQPIDDYFDSLLSPGERVVADSGIATKAVSNSYSVKPEKFNELKSLFKRKIGDFVIEKISYGVAPALRKLLDDRDYENGDVVRGSVVIEQRTSIKYELSKN